MSSLQTVPGTLHVRRNYLLVVTELCQHYVNKILCFSGKQNSLQLDVSITGLIVSGTHVKPLLLLLLTRVTNHLHWEIVTYRISAALTIQRTEKEHI